MVLLKWIILETIDGVLVGLSIFLKEAELEVNSKKTNYTKMFATIVNYDKTNSTVLTCDGKQCKDTCSGDSGENAKL